jgi:hypothetical protein
MMVTMSGVRLMRRSIDPTALTRTAEWAGASFTWVDDEAPTPTPMPRPGRFAIMRFQLRRFWTSLVSRVSVPA